MSKLHSGPVAQLGCMVFSFGYSLFIWVWSFHLGMVFSFAYGLFIRAWSFHGPPDYTVLGLFGAH